MLTVSVGIPTFNRASFLHQAITSILRQSFQDYEIIVSDDGSTDNTAQVVAAFQDARIHYHRTASNLRPPRNWNECVRLARGKYFALLPDDDAYTPDFLAAMVHALQSQPDVGMAQSGFYLTDDQFRVLMPMMAHNTMSVLRGEDALIWEIQHLDCPPVALVFLRSAMLDLGLWREDYWDDWAFIIRLAYRRGVVFVPQLLACNRIHPKNLNRELAAEGRDAILDLINQQVDVFREALPLSPRLLVLRTRLDRMNGHHAILLMLSALRRGKLSRARFHWMRARQLNAMAGFDLGFVALWFQLRGQAWEQQVRQHAAQLTQPILQFGKAI